MQTRFRGQRPLTISWDWVTCKLEQACISTIPSADSFVSYVYSNETHSFERIFFNRATRSFLNRFYFIIGQRLIKNKRNRRRKLIFKIISEKERETNFYLSYYNYLYILYACIISFLLKHLLSIFTFVIINFPSTINFTHRSYIFYFHYRSPTYPAIRRKHTGEASVYSAIRQAPPPSRPLPQA